MQVTRYSFDNRSAIQQVDFRKLESGTIEAFLHAPDDAAQGDLAAVPLSLAKKGLSSVSDTMEGESVLRVTGFKSPEEFINGLRGSGFLSGEAQVDTVGEKDHKPFADRVRKQTVKISGLFGIVGHAAMAVAGALQGDKERIATSAFYIAATSTSALYGAGKPGAEFQQYVDEAKAYLKQQGVEIPKSEKLTAEELAKKGGVIDKLHEFIQQKPLEVGNTLGLAGNVALTMSGINEKRKLKADAASRGESLRGEGAAGTLRAVSGVASMIGALTTILVQEKKREPGEAKSSSPVARAVDFVREKPLRFAGLLNYTGNVLLAMDATKGYSHNKAALAQAKGALDAGDGDHNDLVKQYKQARNAHMGSKFMFATAAAYLLATTFTTLSSKTKVPDYDDRETLGKLTAMSAELLAEVPPAMRTEAIDKMADFLAKNEKVTESREEIATILNEKVDSLGKSPWQAKVGAQQAVITNVAVQNNLRI